MEKKKIIQNYMKKLSYFLSVIFIAVGLSACSPDDEPVIDPPAETPENPDSPKIRMFRITRTSIRIRQQERPLSFITALRTTCILSSATCVRKSTRIRYGYNRQKKVSIMRQTIMLSGAHRFKQFAITPATHLPILP